MRRSFSFLLAFALIASLSSHALAEEAVLPSEGLEALFGFYYTDESQQTRILPPSAEYSRQVLSYATPLSSEQEQNGLRFSARRFIAVDNLYALEWTIENISSAPRLLSLDNATVDERVGAFSGHSLSNIVLLPGESQMGYAKIMTPEVTGEAGHLCLSYFEYAVDEAIIPEDRAKAVYPDENQVQFLCEDRFELDLPRSSGPKLMPDSDCFEAEAMLGDMTLRLIDAQLCLSNGSFTFEGVFDTREAALAHNPCGLDSGWGVQMKFDPGVPLSEWIDGTEWIQTGGGNAPNEPVELPDGRWTWRMTLTADLLHALPETIYLVPYTQNGDEPLESHPDQSIELHFTIAP